MGMHIVSIQDDNNSYSALVGIDKNTQNQFRIIFFKKKFVKVKKLTYNNVQNCPND